jgi:cell volume regulation protein A
VVGTFLTVAATAVLLHLAFGLAWYVALLVATAVAPTDPAVVFSVLGQREVSGRAGTILEGESGANDPVGIALMASLIAAGSVGAAAFAHAGGEFLLQIVVRDGQIVPIKDDTRLRPGDEVLVLAEPGLHRRLTTAFEGRPRH